MQSDLDQTPPLKRGFLLKSMWPELVALRDECALSAESEPGVTNLTSSADAEHRVNK